MDAVSRRLRGWLLAGLFAGVTLLPPEGAPQRDRRFQSSGQMVESWTICSLIRPECAGGVPR